MKVIRTLKSFYAHARLTCQLFDSLNFRPIESVKISCVKKFISEIYARILKYNDVNRLRDGRCCGCSRYRRTAGAGGAGIQKRLIDGHRAVEQKSTAFIFSTKSKI